MPTVDDVVYNITMLRLVLDTDVLFAAFHSEAGASRRVSLEVLEGRAGLLLSTSLMLEYEAVLTRPDNLKAFGIGMSEVLEVLDEIAGLAIPVAFSYRWRPEALDPDDDHVLETAINGGADMIASFNVADIGKGAARFGIAVERPGDVLKRLRT